MKRIIIAAALSAFASSASAMEWKQHNSPYTSESTAFSCAAVYSVASDRLFDMGQIDDARSMALHALNLYIKTNAPTDGFVDYQTLRREYLNATDDVDLWKSVRMCIAMFIVRAP